MNCPICNEEVEEHTHDTINNTVCEEYASCRSRGHFYDYEYAYGAEKESIGAITIERYYTDSKQVGIKKNEILKLAIELAKIEEGE